MGQYIFLIYGFINLFLDALQTDPALWPLKLDKNQLEKLLYKLYKLLYKCRILDIPE